MLDREREREREGIDLGHTRLGAPPKSGGGGTQTVMSLAAQSCHDMSGDGLFIIRTLGTFAASI